MPRILIATMNKEEFLSGDIYREFVYQHERDLAQQTADMAAPVEAAVVNLTNIPDEGRRYTIPGVLTMTLYEERHHAMNSAGECSPLCAVDRRMLHRMLAEELVKRGWTVSKDQRWTPDHLGELLPPTTGEVT